ncbi:hemerythrin domain-containing protein [Candidatus Pacearchaeota archaeon]|nr:hemerythrin domain-containing protein [Candidatus Pacearchaeota archaeon]
MSEISNILSDEHKNILLVIDLIIDKSDKIQSEDKASPLSKDNEKFWIEIVEFIRNYADKFHHAKEEEILFKEFCKKESELHCNPVEQMLYEHDLGRKFVKELEEGIKENNKEKISENALGYANLLKEHIFKEDDILYPMAEEVLDEKTKGAIIKKFRDIENKKKHEKEKYLNFVEKIKK